MRDPVFANLLTILDGIPAGPASIASEASGDFSAAHERLRATQRMLGAAVQESPYIAFARRLVSQPEQLTQHLTQHLALSA